MALARRGRGGLRRQGRVHVACWSYVHDRVVSLGCVPVRTAKPPSVHRWGCAQGCAQGRFCSVLYFCLIGSVRDHEFIHERARTFNSRTLQVSSLRPGAGGSATLGLCMGERMVLVQRQDPKDISPSLGFARAQNARAISRREPTYLACTGAPSARAHRPHPIIVLGGAWRDCVKKAAT